MLGPALVRREPVGVVGAIVPWNVPLFVTMLKLGAGARRRRDGGAEAGAGDAARRDPPRRGDRRGRAAEGRASTSCRPAARSASTWCAIPTSTRSRFTGSTAAGRRIAAICGEQLKRVTLELGGKSAAIILDDADLGVDDRRAAAGDDHEQRPGVRRADAHPRLAPALRRGRRRARSRPCAARGRRSAGPGDAVRAAGRRAPARARRGLHRDRPRRRRARRRRRRPPEGLSRRAGTSSRRSSPTSTTACASRARRSSARCSRSSPTTTRPTRSRIANDSDYGLSGTVWTADVERGLDVARRVRTGTYTVNGFAMEFSAPFGGFKCSRHRPRARPGRAERVPRAEDDQPADGLPCRRPLRRGYRYALRGSPGRRAGWRAQPASGRAAGLISTPRFARPRHGGRGYPRARRRVRGLLGQAGAVGQRVVHGVAVDDDSRSG